MTLIGLTLAAGALQGGVFALGKKRRKSKRLVDHLQSQEEKEKNDLLEIIPEEKTINQNLLLSTGLVGLTALGRLGHPVLLACSLPGLLYLDMTFLISGVREFLNERKLGIGLVDAIVTMGMFFLSSFFTNALFLVLYFTSRKLLHRIHNNAGMVTFKQPEPMGQSIWLLQDGIETEIPLLEAKQGDVVVVNSGESVPVDGVIVDGQATITQPLLAEDVPPLERGVGQVILSSSYVSSGRICVQVEQVGEQTLATQIGMMLNRENRMQAPARLEGEQTIDKGTLPLLAVSAITLQLLDLRRAIAVLLTNFGNDFRIVLPLSHLSYLKIALKQGILIKDGLSLERLQGVTYLIFDGFTPNEIQWLTQNFQPHNCTCSGVEGEDRAMLVSQIESLQQAGERVGFVYRGTPGRPDSADDHLAAMKLADISILLCGISTSGVDLAEVLLLNGQIELLPYLFELAQGLKTNTKRSLLITMAPSILCLGGVYFFHSGLMTSLLLDHLGLVGGLTNAMAPRLGNSAPDYSGMDSLKMADGDQNNGFCSMPLQPE